MSIPSWCRVGAKVVCVDASPRVGARARDLDGLTRGVVYTIRSVFEEDGELCLRLAEIVRPIRIEDILENYGTENGFAATRFRPLVTRSQEQDIAEHFSHHLHQRASRKTEERV